LQSGSLILDGFKSQYTATTIQRLLDADAIIIGRQNCDEFAMGSTNENPYYGPTINAADPTRVPGGSSGASAVAVQAGFCIASIGSDTGGSVRQPAAFCGVVGFKPSYSRLSRYGLVAYASSFDSIGTLTHNAEDAALLMQVMAGKDELDSTSSSLPVPQFSSTINELTTNKKIAVLAASLNEAINPEIREALQAQIGLYKAQGYQVDIVDFPLIDFVLPTYYILTTAEASSNLSRFDGVRYGYRSSKATDLESMYKLSRSEGFGIEVKRRIMLGTFVLSASYYDAYFTKAQKVRRLIKEATEGILAAYDFIITPTTPTTAFKIGEVAGDPIAMYLGDVFTVQANVAGICGVSIPIGTDTQGLSIGMQIMAGAFQEEKLLQFAHFSLSNFSESNPV
jgi:aspartyl-tRNA(Asn)/glutamyl-tRNA(Gln) amidotransferase subunit A